MNQSNFNPLNNTTKEEDHTQQNNNNNTLPKIVLFDGSPMYYYQGFWAHSLEGIVSFRTHFQAHDTDILATSFRKVGTTWLKSLLFAICDRTNHPCSASPLLIHNPHKLVPHLESNIYANSNKCPADLTTLKSPRLFGTHVPFPSLPSSIHDSNCKIVYLCRNPFDTFVSSYLFYQAIDTHVLKPEMLDAYFNMFCEGKVPFGPFPEHVLAYWKASLETPTKVLFLKYEDLKADPTPHVKRMAEFVGCPFTREEEEEGVIDDIVKLCSIKNLKEVAESNKNDRVYPIVSNDKFFRKGEVGDWKKHMTPTMADKLKMIMEHKFHDSGLTFKYE